MKYRNEIVIALIGLVGVIFTAIASNYDKLFSEPVSPYENIDDIETQLRYYVDISGIRKALEEMDKSVAERYKQKYQVSEAEINCMMDIRLQKEQLIELFIRVNKQHVSLKQIKDINRFYSSESMKSFNSLSPIISRDLFIGMSELYERLHIRNRALAGTSINNERNSCQ